MLLTVAAALAVFGVGLWILGVLFDLQGISTIGGVIVFGCGVLLLEGGLSVPAGVTKTAVNNSTTVVEQQYRAVSMPTNLSLGFLVSLVGGSLTLRGLSQNVS